MLPVLFSFATPLAVGLSIGLGLAYAAFHLWRDGVKEGQRPATWGALVGAGAAFAAYKYGKPVPLHTYGLLVASAFLIGTWLAGREARRLTPIYARIRKGKDFHYPAEEDVLDVSFWILVAALIGSRLLFVIVNWDHYRKNPGNFFSLSGGLVFYGGLIGALAASIVFARMRKIRFLELSDVVIPQVALGHTLGRLGCFAAGCCWGKVCDADYLFSARFPREALAYSSQLGAGLIPSGAATTLPLHPTQLYEAAGELAIFFLLLVVRSRLKRFHGQVLLTYFICYALLRTSIESFRGDYERGMLFRWPAENPLLLSTSQFISFFFAAAGVVLLVWLQRRRASAQPE